MTPNRLLLWKRYFSCPVLIVIAAIFLCFSLPSCFPPMIEGSYDGSTEHEGGPSALVDRQDLGFNLAAEWNLGLNGSGGERSAGDRVHTLVYDNDGIPTAGYPEMFDPHAAGNGKWLLATKLELIQKGSKFQDSRTRLNYLAVMEDARYQYTFGDQSAVFGGLGPYIAYGIGGNVKGPDLKRPPLAERTGTSVLTPGCT
jgi:hypothetical protein